MSDEKELHKPQFFCFEKLEDQMLLLLNKQLVRTVTTSASKSIAHE